MKAVASDHVKMHRPLKGLGLLLWVIKERFGGLNKGSNVSWFLRNYTRCYMDIRGFFIDVWIQLSPFSHHHFPPPTHPHLPPSILSPFGFVHVSFIHFHLPPFPFFPMLFPSSLPSGHCQFVLNFNISGYILLDYLFCWLDSTYRWDHIEFVFQHLAYFT